MRFESLELVRSAMSDTFPRRVDEIAEKSGLGRATVYNALAVLKADKHHVGKNDYAYTLRDEAILDLVEEPGTIEGISWREYTQRTLSYVSQVHFRGNPDPKGFEKGFRQISEAFALIAEHIHLVRERPDWRIVLGLDIDTEKKP